MSECKCSAPTDCCRRLLHVEGINKILQPEIERLNVELDAFEQLMVCDCCGGLFEHVTSGDHNQCDNCTELANVSAEVSRYEKLAWLAAQDWVFWSEYNGKNWSGPPVPVIITNEVFVPASDAYPLESDHIDDVYRVAKDGGYEAIIDWIIERTGWSRWRKTDSGREPPK